MKRVLASAAIGLAIGPFLPGLPSAGAVDHGQMGQTWAVAEPDLLEVIRAKLEQAEADGGLGDMQRRFASRVESRVKRPLPVAGIGPAAEDRAWEFDPAITIERDILDHQGNVLAVAGQRVNPLDTVAMRQKLIFVNGDRPAEVEWAMAQGEEHSAKIILVDGSPFDLMKAHRRRFYFDQSGALIRHFGIAHTPAAVSQDGDILMVRETAVLGEGA